MSSCGKLAIVTLVALVGGCGVEGRWVLREVRPAVGHEDFTVARASFYPNHSFEAVAVKDGQTVKAKGTWHYCCCRNELTLDTGEKRRVYKAFRTCRNLQIDIPAKDGEMASVVMCPAEQCDWRCDDEGSCAGCD